MGGELLTVFLDKGQTTYFLSRKHRYQNDELVPEKTITKQYLLKQNEDFARFC